MVCPGLCRDIAKRKRPAEAGRMIGSLAKTELRDECGVALVIFLADVIQQGAALVDHHQEPAAGMIVLRVRLEVGGEIVDSLGEDRDLDLGGSGVARACFFTGRKY